MSNDLFDTDNLGPVIDPNKDYSSELVGEGKKFKDYAALARSKVESDHFIESLKREAAELRQELMSRSKLEDIVNTLSKPPERLPDPPVQQEQNVKQFSAEDLEAMLENKLTQREANKRKEENVRATQLKLTEAFGNSYVDVLKEKAAEIGVDPSWFNSLAADNPKALLKLVGAENTVQRTNDLFSPPPASHQSGFKPTNSDRDKAYYDKIKQTDPKTYWHKDTQVAMHKDAMRLGERFFS